MHIDLDLTAIRRTARYHLASLFIEKLQRESGRRVRLRRCRHHVYEVAVWLNAGLELHEPADQIDDITVAVALSDVGFSLMLTGRGDLRTDCSAEAMHRYGREMRNADAPLHLEGGTWTPVFSPFDMQWSMRLARLDAELVAMRGLH